MEQSIGNLLSKCQVYYDNELISKETVLERYLSFFANTMGDTSHRIGIALHTGDMSFDVVSVVAVGLGCIAQNLSTNDEILAALNRNDIVMYNGQRYRWIGIQEVGGCRYLVIEQDGTGKNGNIKSFVRYEENKHLIVPYYGNSRITDGRGVKQEATNREDFFSHVLDLPLAEVPTQIDVSVIVVAGRTVFENIYRKVSIEYENGKKVGLLDIAPASYYTNIDTPSQFGANPSKAEPIYKVTDNMSVARDLVLDKNGNRVIGLLICGASAHDAGTSELPDLLRRHSLKFAFVTSPVHTKLAENITDFYEEAALFACTKEYLETLEDGVVCKNPYTERLQQQINTIINSKTDIIKVHGGIEKEVFWKIRHDILAIKESALDSEIKDEFIITAQSTLNLFCTAVFSMEEMDQAIQSGRLDSRVKLPTERIDRLLTLSLKTEGMQDRCLRIVETIEQLYNQLRDNVPKENLLMDIIASNGAGNMAIIVPKAYYKDVMLNVHPQWSTMPNIHIFTPNAFDRGTEFDNVIIVGEMYSKKFDPLQISSAKHIYILLYECEQKAYGYRQRIKQKYDYKLNAKLGLLSDSQIEDIQDVFEKGKTEDQEMQKYISLDEYMEELSLLTLRNSAIRVGQASGGTATAEVTYIGTFTSGESILFSKYYSAVVFDSARGTVIEKPPENLLPGDILVFTVRNDYTKNIVDILYAYLLNAEMLGDEANDQYVKSLYWKTVLRQYKKDKDFGYGDLAVALKNAGCPLHEVSIRQWLVEDSHIVGPRDIETLRAIGRLTGNKSLQENAEEYYEACNNVRRQRRGILGLIAGAISSKLIGSIPESGSILEIVFNNVEKLSQTLELDEIIRLENSVGINVNLVNRPISEEEVSM